MGSVQEVAVRPGRPPALQLPGRSGLQRQQFGRAPSLALERRVAADSLGRHPLQRPDASSSGSSGGGSSSGSGSRQPDLASRAVVAEREAPPAGGAAFLSQQAQQLQALLQLLRGATSYEAKLAVLRQNEAVRHFLSSSSEGQIVGRQLELVGPKEGYVLLCLPAIGQAHVLSTIPTGLVLNAEFARLAASLCGAEEFYDSIGGLVGYQLQCTLLAADHARAAAGGGGGERGGGGVAGSPAACKAGGIGAAELLVPVGLDLSSPLQREAAAAAAAAGLAATPFLAEVYPLGGAGDRLGLCCEETGEGLPTAVLRYCGRTLLEALVRDVAAREYLYWQVHGRQLTTPVAVMTSAAKGNHWRVAQLFEGAAWFGRGRESFRLFQQPLVPVVAAEDARWLLAAPLSPALKPGGHGAIWKLMVDAGVFDWLAGQGRTAAIVRQISNPMAGMDSTLLALAGTGHAGGRAFGFASCDRVVGAAEGMNVLLQQRVPILGEEDGASTASSTNGRAYSTNGHANGSGSSSVSGSGGAGSTAAVPQRYRYQYRVTNVEYTEFERLGVEDAAREGQPTFSKFPANTNVLYVGLKAVEAAVRQGMAAGSTSAVLPGMLLNLGKELCYRDATAGGVERRVKAGRLECTMQNLADVLGQSFDAPLGSDGERAGLDTFLVYNQRRKVTSSAKKKLTPGTTRIHQTPDGSFYDLMLNGRELLAACEFAVPEVGGVPEYLATGPGFIFLFHPALGPLWEVVAQKLRRGRLAPRAELQLEVAEADVEGLALDGSLRVLAHAPLGHTAQHAQQDGRPEPRLEYSQRCGRVRLRNVRVANRGVDWASPRNIYWRHRVHRHESCQISLHGCSEFEARDVELRGDLRFDVPDGQRMVVTAGAAGGLQTALHPLGADPTWRWEYCLQPDGRIQLAMRE